MRIECNYKLVDNFIHQVSALTIRAISKRGQKNFELKLTGQLFVPNNRTKSGLRRGIGLISTDVPI